MEGGRFGNRGRGNSWRGHGHGQRGYGRGRNWRPRDFSTSRSRRGSHSHDTAHERTRSSEDNPAVSPSNDQSSAMSKPVKFTRILRKEGVILRRARGNREGDLTEAVSSSGNSQNDDQSTHVPKQNINEDNKASNTHMVDLHQDRKEKDDKLSNEDPVEAEISEKITVNAASPISDISDPMDDSLVFHSEMSHAAPTKPKKATVKVIKRSDGSTVVVSGGKIIKKKPPPSKTLDIKPASVPKKITAPPSKDAKSPATKTVAVQGVAAKEVATVKPKTLSASKPTFSSTEILTIKRTINTESQNFSTGIAQSSSSHLLPVHNETNIDSSLLALSRTTRKKFVHPGIHQVKPNERICSSRPLRSVHQSSPPHNEQNVSKSPTRRIVRRKRPSITDANAGDQLTFHGEPPQKSSWSPRRKILPESRLSPNADIINRKPYHPKRAVNTSPRHSQSFSPPPRFTNSKRDKSKSTKEPLLKRTPPRTRRSPPRRQPHRQSQSPVKSYARSRSSSPRRSLSPRRSRSSSPRNISILEMLLGKRNDNSSEDELKEKPVSRRRRSSSEVSDRKPAKLRKHKADQFPKTKILGDSENIPRLLEEERRQGSQAARSKLTKKQLVESSSLPEITDVCPVPIPYPQNMTTPSGDVPLRKQAVQALQSQSESSRTVVAKSSLTHTVQQMSDTNPIRSRKGKYKKSSVLTERGEIDNMLEEEERLQRYDGTTKKHDSDMEMSGSDTDSNKKTLTVEPEDGQTPSFRKVSAPMEVPTPGSTKIQKPPASIKIKLAKELEEDSLAELQNDLDHIQTSQDVADNIQAVENKIRALVNSNLGQVALTKRIKKYQTIVSKIFAKATKIKEMEDAEASKVTYHQRSQADDELDGMTMDRNEYQYQSPLVNPYTHSYPTESAAKSPEEINPHTPLDPNYSQAYDYSTPSYSNIQYGTFPSTDQTQESPQMSQQITLDGEIPLKADSGPVMISELDHTEDQVERLNKQYVSQQPGYFVCLLCKIECKSQKSFDLHLNGKKHAQYIQEKIADPTARFKPPKLPKKKRHYVIVRCVLCEVICKGEDKYNSHCLEPCHVKTTQEYVNLGRSIPDPEILYDHNDDIKEQVDKIEEEGVPAVGRDYVMKKNIKDYDDNVIEVFHCKLCKCNLRNEVQVERHIRCKKHYLIYVKVVTPELNVPVNASEHKKRKMVEKKIYHAMQNVRRVEESLELEELEKPQSVVQLQEIDKQTPIEAVPVSPPSQPIPQRSFASEHKRQIQSTSVFLERAAEMHSQESKQSYFPPISGEYPPGNTKQYSPSFSTPITNNDKNTYKQAYLNHDQLYYNRNVSESSGQCASSAGYTAQYPTNQNQSCGKYSSSQSATSVDKKMHDSIINYPTSFRTSSLSQPDQRPGGNSSFGKTSIGPGTIYTAGEAPEPDYSNPEDFIGNSLLKKNPVTSTRYGQQYGNTVKRHSSSGQQPSTGFPQSTTTNTPQVPFNYIEAPISLSEPMPQSNQAPYNQRPSINATSKPLYQLPDNSEIRSDYQGYHGNQQNEAQSDVPPFKNPPIVKYLNNPPNNTSCPVYEKSHPEFDRGNKPVYLNSQSSFNAPSSNSVRGQPSEGQAKHQSHQYNDKSTYSKYQNLSAGSYNTTPSYAKAPAQGARFPPPNSCQNQTPNQGHKDTTNQPYKSFSGPSVNPSPVIPAYQSTSGHTQPNIQRSRQSAAFPMHPQRQQQMQQQQQNSRQGGNYYSSNY